MRFKARHHLGAALLVLFAHTSMISCSSSDETDGVTEEVGDGENAAAEGNAATEEGQGDEAKSEDGAANQEGGGDAQEGNTAEASGEEGADNSGQAAPAEGGDDQAAATEGGQQGDLQEIIDEMNSTGGDANGAQVENAQPAAGANGGEAVAEGNAPAADGANVAAPADGNAAPANAAATLAPAANGAPAATADVPAPANDSSGLPEMNAKMSYIVQKGDTLVKIAQKIYGDATKWTEVASFTGLANPKLIYPGDVVYYQLNDTTKPFAMAYESVKRNEVQVQQGDTLSTIAGRVLGSNENWKLIWRQNDNIDDPDKLMVGTTVYYVEPTALASAVTHFREQIAQQAKQLKTNTAVATVETATQKQPTAKIAIVKTNKTAQTKINVLDEKLANSVDNEIEADLISVNMIKNLNAARI